MVACFNGLTEEQIERNRGFQGNYEKMFDFRKVTYEDDLALTYEQVLEMLSTLPQYNAFENEYREFSRDFKDSIYNVCKNGPGWSAYMPVDGEEPDVESDYFIFPKEKRRIRISQILARKLNAVWFRYLVRGFSSAIYEIDNLEAGSFDKEQRLLPRARLLLRENLDELVDMFRYTENHLHSTLINRQPPYYSNYLRH